jgi:N utilization substance protein A
LYEDEGVGLVTVPDYQLSLAIGREGQNVRLAARLTGWRLDITSETEAEEARNRYLQQREEQVEAPEFEPVEGETELQEDADLHGVDPELIRKLEEFKRTMFDPSRRGGEG